MGMGEAHDEAKEICEYYNHITHGDPVSADSNLVPLGDGSLGHSVGKVLGNPALCDALATQGRSYLGILVAGAVRCFPEVKPPPSVVH